MILTADHGGRGAGHYDPTSIHDYRIPFVVWGSGVDPGTDLYDLNPDYADPGRARVAYDGVQPVRNGMVANLALDLLGLPAVPGSEHDVAQDLGRQRGLTLPRLGGPAAQRSPGSGHGLKRQPREPLGLLHHHRRRTALPRAADVSAAQPVAGLVVDHHVAVVAQRLPCGVPRR